jgi:para-nitrobenzyl esterase
MRYSIALILLSPWLFVGLNSSASDLDTVVKLDSGYVSGTGTAVRSYKGIPYAAPPIGEFRWRAPQPAKPWTPIRLAKSFSASCVQTGAIPGAGRLPTSEDCLTINVWTPARRADEKLPVLFSIHGGGFEIGSSIASVYNGEPLASQGVVVVTFNYRVGVLGFFAHPELSKESQRGSGNYGLLDMLAALRWTQKNISAFGGDPNNVTIWGESAGASAVSLLLVVPEASELFHKAIANSPWCMYYPMRRLKENWAGREASETTGARMGTLAELRAKSIEELLKLDQGVINAGVLGADAIERGGLCRPIVDGVVIPDDPANLFAAGKFHSVPLMMGTNADEGTVPLFAPRVTNHEQSKAWLHSTYGAEAAPKLAILYRIDSDANARSGAIKVSGDALFAMGARSMLRATAKRTHDVYQYEFTRVNALGRRTQFGASHGADVGYTFGTLPDSLFSAMGLPTLPDDYDAVDARLSREMMGAIVQFAKTGNPNNKDLPNWPSYREQESYLEYGDRTVVRQHLRPQQLDALDAIFVERRAR